MKWIINNKIGNNKEEQSIIQHILCVICDQFEKMIPDGPPLGYKDLTVSSDLSMGHMVSWAITPSNYLISINGDKIDFDKIAFQFARGIGHIYCDPRVNNWFIEVLCHISSLFYLDYLVKVWQEKGLDITTGSNLDDFTSYKNFIVSNSFNGVDLVQYQVSNKWIRNEVNKLRNNPGIIDRDRIVLVAIELLPIFMKYEKAWRLLPYIGKSSIPETYKKPEGYIPSINSKPDFRKLLDLLPNELIEIFEKICSKILENGY